MAFDNIASVGFLDVDILARWASEYSWYGMPVIRCAYAKDIYARRPQ